MGLATDVESVLGGLLSKQEEENLAVDAIPRSVEGVIYTMGVHAAAGMEQLIADLSPILGAGSPLIQLLGELESELNGVLVPPAGSAIVKLLPVIVAQIQAYVAANGSGLPVSLAGRSVAAASEIAAVLAKYAAPVAAPPPAVVETIAESPAAVEPNIGQ